MVRSQSRQPADGVRALVGQDPILAEIVRSIPTCAPLWNRSKRTVAALIGATGVGKTTTVVKLAGQAALMHNKRVGIITLDSYRAGKVRSLEGFARAIGVDVREASNRTELQAAAREFATCDLILIDTPGLNPWHFDKRKELLNSLDFPDVEDGLQNVLDFQENRIANQWIPFYSERSAWSTRPMDKFRDGLVRDGPQAVSDYEAMLEANKAKRAAPSEDVAPRVPGNFYKTEEEDAGK